MVLREGQQGLRTKGKTESFPKELWGGGGPGFGVSVGLGSLLIFFCVERAPGDHIMLSRCSASEPHPSSGHSCPFLFFSSV